MLIHWFIVVLAWLQYIQKNCYSLTLLYVLSFSDMRKYSSALAVKAVDNSFWSCAKTFLRLSWRKRRYRGRLSQCFFSGMGGGEEETSVCGICSMIYNATGRLPTSPRPGIRKWSRGGSVQFTTFLEDIAASYDNTAWVLFSASSWNSFICSKMQNL